MCWYNASYLRKACHNAFWNGVLAGASVVLIVVIIVLLLGG